VGIGGGHEFLEGFEGYAVVASGGLDGADTACEDPMLEGGVADADFVSGLAGREQGGRGHGVFEVPPRQYFTRFRKGTPSGMGKLSIQLCDCSHSTVVSTDDSLPVAFPQ